MKSHGHAIDNTPLNFTGPTNARQHAVVDAFKHAWSGYERTAWGHDNAKPLSNTFYEWYHLGLTIVDSLDTLYIMNLTDGACRCNVNVLWLLNFSYFVWQNSKKRRNGCVIIWTFRKLAVWASMKWRSVCLVAFCQRIDSAEMMCFLVERWVAYITHDLEHKDLNHFSICVSNRRNWANFWIQHSIQHLAYHIHSSAWTIATVNMRTGSTAFQHLRAHLSNWNSLIYHGSRITLNMKMYVKELSIPKFHFLIKF